MDHWTKLARADGASKSMPLQAVMRSLGRDMEALTDAISKEDWALAAATAQRIADHAEAPASERKLVADWLGSESELFEDLDERTHEAARTLRRAAERADGRQVIETFAALQIRCLACHQRFRKGFVKHFHGQQG